MHELLRDGVRETFPALPRGRVLLPAKLRLVLRVRACAAGMRGGVRSVRVSLGGFPPGPRATGCGPSSGRPRSRWRRCSWPSPSSSAANEVSLSAPFVSLCVSGRDTAPRPRCVPSLRRRLRPRPRGPRRRRRGLRERRSVRPRASVHLARPAALSAHTVFRRQCISITQMICVHTCAHCAMISELLYANPPPGVGLRRRLRRGSASRRSPRPLRRTSHRSHSRRAPGRRAGEPLKPRACRAATPG